jgi:Skp family chaperone for outer membrane proteins
MKNILTLAALTLLVAACSSAGAQNSGYQSGDRVFNSSQTK